MNNKMPMPAMPNPNSGVAETESATQFPFTEDSTINVGSEVEASIPSNEVDFNPPKIIDPGANNSVVAGPVFPKNGIDVVATGKGFYNQERLKADDTFKIRSEEDFGEWFYCVDKEFEQKRIAFLKNKKLKAKK